MKTIPVHYKNKIVAYVQVSDEDADLMQWEWWYSKGAYARRGKRIEGKKVDVYIHRIVLERTLGRPLVKGEQVDHINHNTFDNQRSNLRLSTPRQNMMNQRRQRRSSSGVKGVYLNKGVRKWSARIIIHRKALYLGSFLHKEEAALAYQNKAKELFGEFYCQG